MIPLLPALALAFLSFFSSVFVILRIVVPILPPHPLSRRVSPAEFGLPNFRSLSVADQSHIWLACLDILALVFFIWQTINEYTGGPSDYAIALDPASSLRLWLATTLRQTCLLMVVGLTLLHVRLGRSVTFGVKQWMLWAPTLMLVATSTGIAVVMPGASVPSLFIGIASYTTTIGVLTSIAFCCLIGTLFAIKRNLAVVEESEPWPPAKQIEQGPRPSFATEEVDGLRDGASWITSNASNVSSRPESVSAWSFSTHGPSMHGGRPQGGSVPAKSSFWFSGSTPPDAPPVPPLPSSYAGPVSPTAQGLNDTDPFRRDAPPETRPRFDSQTSWLTSSQGTHKTVSAWSYPTTHGRGDETPHNGSMLNVNAELLPSTNTAVTRPSTPALANAKVLGGYGFAAVPDTADAEKSLAGLAASGAVLDSPALYRALGWLITIWVPLVLSLPYSLLNLQATHTPAAASILLILSVTLSSPLLALHLLFRSPIPIPHSGLFGVHGDLPANALRGSAPSGSTPTYKWSHEYKHSTSASVTVVEGRRSGDVWMTNGNAVDGKSRVGRVMGMMGPRPKLSVLPVEEESGEPLTPPLPIQTEDESSLPISIHNSTQDEMSAQFGRLRQDSKASSSGSALGDESMAYASRIMVAQRHYSAVAKTLLFSGSPEKEERRMSAGGHLVAASGVGPSSRRQSGHLRTRSNSSVPHSPTTDSHSVSPPPSFPLPPTPPNVRAARLARLGHKKSFSSGGGSGFSFGPVDDINEIDALTAGVLPLLVPGLRVGGDVRIKGSTKPGEWTPPESFSRAKGKKALAGRRMKEFGEEDFSSPQIHSTPARTRANQGQARSKKTSMHKRHHFSLPSLGLDKDGVHSLANWKDDINRALENQVGRYTALPANVDLDGDFGVGRRATVFGGELRVVDEEDVQDGRPQAPSRGLKRGLSARRLGLQSSEVPHDARVSLGSLNLPVSGPVPASANSEVTLFDDFEDGLQSGPQAESTPHNTVKPAPHHKQRPPPLPLGVTDHLRDAERRSNRRSSIVYIVSPAPETQVNTPNQWDDTPPPASAPSAMSSLAQWSSRVMGKPAKLQRKISESVYGSGSANANAKPSSPGLRPLRLLGERDVNGGGTPPLSLRKKNKALNRVFDDENSPPSENGVSSLGSRRSVKALQLARTETRVGA
ncbi:hypothetical protein FB45DRAFT_828169 [Roridomyces roridus]|uniref:Uncharacterized protein n=1 Tax=Roridomyces roridus TaxID=1738132 RepID=A0AAD7FUC3_9AGAR|nr:hypothetical protein FB45DRAFT_828169 [Roridomyces roridus]